jgi:hypothetical protein
MHQTRPQRPLIQSTVPHGINILTNGGYLSAPVKKSMEEVASSLNLMNEIFLHKGARRSREIHNIVRIEIFLVFNNEGISISALPHFDPTSCMQMFESKLVNDFEDEVVRTHLVPINKIFHDVGRLAEENQLLHLDDSTGAIKTRVIASLEILVVYTDDAIGNEGTIQKNI